MNKYWSFLKYSLAMALLALGTALYANVVTVREASAFLRLDPENSYTLPATWNGDNVVFTFYPVRKIKDDVNDYWERNLAVVYKTNGNALKSVYVTTGEIEDGNAAVEAIGFASLKGSADKKLVVILKWPVRHYDVDGDLYEVRLFDSLKVGETRLTPLTQLSRHFGSGCDCDRRNQSHLTYRFKTIAAVKAELQRMGY